jgi:S-adenosylmethionine hydrolase
MEGAVCAMYGVVKSVDRELEIIDGTHQIPRYDIWSASYRLYQTVRFWPEGTIFVSVVDPGVGTARRACAAKTKDGYYIITPDNGTLTHIYRSSGIEAVREIDENINRLRGKGTEGTSVFHGRDIFAFCAARLAGGLITYEETGHEYLPEMVVRLPVDDPVLEDGAVKGFFEIGDPNFGNLWTNIPLDLFNKAGFRYGDILLLQVMNEGKNVFEREIAFEPSFGFADRGKPVIYTNELMNIALAVSMGSAIDEYRLGYGLEWKTVFRKPPV